MQKAETAGKHQKQGRSNFRVSDLRRDGSQTDANEGTASCVQGAKAQSSAPHQQQVTPLQRAVAFPKVTAAGDAPAGLWGRPAEQQRAPPVTQEQTRGRHQPQVPGWPRARHGPGHCAPSCGSAGANHGSGAAPWSRHKENPSECTRTGEGLGRGRQQEGCREAEGCVRQAELCSARRQTGGRPCHSSGWDLLPSSKPGCSALSPRVRWEQAKPKQPDPDPWREQPLHAGARQAFIRQDQFRKP